jgi:hypothetical protein
VQNKAIGLNLSLIVILGLTGCGKPSLDIPASFTTIGRATPVSVHVHDTRGVNQLTASIEQNGAKYQVWQTTKSSSSLDNTYGFTVGLNTTPQLHDGPARLIIEATSAGLFHGSARLERNINVVTQAPVVSADSDQHYLYLGMADLATLNVTGSYNSAGVRVGDQTYRAWPMPGGRPGLFSLFAFAWNMPPGTTPLVFASNDAGNDVTTPLTVIFPKKEQPVYTRHEIQVTDQFMQKVLGELDPNGTGDPVARFVKINSEMRIIFFGPNLLRVRRIRRLKPALQTSAVTFTTARKSTSRYIWATISPLHSMWALKRPTTVVWYGPLRWEFTATASWSIMVTACKPFTGT